MLSNDSFLNAVGVDDAVATAVVLASIVSKATRQKKELSREEKEAIAKLKQEYEANKSEILNQLSEAKKKILIDAIGTITLYQEQQSEIDRLETQKHTFIYLGASVTLLLLLLIVLKK